MYCDDKNCRPYLQGVLNNPYVINFMYGSPLVHVTFPDPLSLLPPSPQGKASAP